MIFLTYHHFISTMAPKFFESVNHPIFIETYYVPGTVWELKYKYKQFPPLLLSFSFCAIFLLMYFVLYLNVIHSIYPTFTSINKIILTNQNIQICLRIILN